MPDKKIPEITPLQAFEILNSDKSSVLIDVRTVPEFEYVGHPVNAVNIPWPGAPSPEAVQDFVKKVRKNLQMLNNAGGPIESLPVLAICRSGRRSMDAAVALTESGFEKVFNVVEGFEGGLDRERHRGTINGWRYHGLPWEQG